MTSSDLKRAKREVRRRVLEARDAIPAEERARRGALVTERFGSLPEVRAARTVLAFWSFGSEVPTRPLIEALVARGAGVALPRIVDGQLEARTYRPGDPTIETSYGAWEPADGTSVDPASIDVIATPGVAFDRGCRRVGYGGGFYDRFLLRTRPDAPRIALAFDVQVLPRGEHLPAGHPDLPVDAVVTESETIRCPGRS
jgi:5-formyltetrahydrofolate cyclo-ligase